MTQPAQTQQTDTGFSWICPTFTVSDVKQASDFYNKAFGFKIIREHTNSKGETLWGSASYNGITIMYSTPDDSNPMTPPAQTGNTQASSLYLYADDVDATYKKAINAGAKSLVAPEDMFWGDRMARVVDSNGYIWEIAKTIGEFDPSKLPPSWL